MVSSILHSKYDKDGLELRDEYLNDPDPDTLAAYDELQQEKQPAAERGMIIGYTIGGVLTAAGITMIVVDVIKNRPKDSKKVSITPGGLSVQF